MADIVDRKTRGRMMSGIRGANTRPEIVVRKHLFATGLRYRLHVSSLPGRPDIVLPSMGAVVFVHGCFWHRHPRCRYAYTPKSNTVFWSEKFDENIARDRQVRAALKRRGWRVHVIWECQINSDRLSRLVDSLRSGK